MEREDAFKCLLKLQEYYEYYKEQLPMPATCYESMMYAFVGSAVALSTYRISTHELDVWIDLNGITAISNKGFIEDLAHDAMQMMHKRYGSVFTQEVLDIDYIIPMKRLMNAIESHNAISS